MPYAKSSNILILTLKYLNPQIFKILKYLKYVNFDPESNIHEIYSLLNQDF